MAAINERAALRYAKALDAGFQNLADKLFEHAVKSIAEKLLVNSQIAAIEYPIFDTGLFSASHVFYRNGKTSGSVHLFDGLRTRDTVGILNEVEYFNFAIYREGRTNRSERDYWHDIKIPAVNIDIQKIIF